MAEQQVPEGYKQTEVGVIPEDWESELVKDSFEICNPLRLPISSKIREGMKGKYPYYGPTKIQDYINEFRVEGVYALIGEDGDHFLKYEKTPQTQLAKGRFNVNNHAHLIKGKKNLTEWFYFFFRNRDISLYLTRQGAGRFKLSKGSLENLPCALPPVREQEEIVSVLSDVDALITSLEKLITKKRAIKTAAMQQLLTGKKRLPPFCTRTCLSSGAMDGKEPISTGKRLSSGAMDGKEPISTRKYLSSGAMDGKEPIDKTHAGYKQTELGEIPEDWEIVNLESVSAFITKGSTPTTYGFKWEKSGIPFLRSECVAEDGLDMSESMFISKEANKALRRSEVAPEDILITITGNVGRVIYLDDSFVEGNINQHIARIRITDDRAFSRYVFHYLSQPEIRKYFNTITTGQAYPQISLSQVRSAEIPLPSNEEQAAIASVLTDLASDIEALEKRLTKTKNLKQAMMQELLTGRTRLI